MATTSEIVGGRYRLGRVLGQGAMSEVFEATDERTGVAVAVKVVRSGDPEFARRLAQEARALERLEHRGLVRLLDTGSTGSNAYLVMELVRGSTLAAVLTKGPLTPKQTSTVGAQLADALAFVHESDIVHRDVKPSNILVTGDGEARLADFGIARMLDASTLTLAGTTLGTAAYMAPEQLENHQVGPSADIWSLGMVLLECLTGQRVYEGSPSEVVARRLAGPVPLPADLPVTWKLVLSGMLDHRPDQRLAGAEVAALLLTAPFGAPWKRSPTQRTERLASSVPNDLTALAPGSATTVLTPAIDADATRVQPLLIPHATRARSWRLPAFAALALAVLIVALLLGLSSSPNAQHGTTTTTTTSTTTTTTSTTTTLPSAPAALGALVSEIAAGESAGSLQPDVGQSIANAAQMAITDEMAGKTSQATADLQQAATSIADGVKNHKIAQAEGTTLQTDLSALATALGLGAAGTPPTTQASGPGNNGPGNNG